MAATAVWVKVLAGISIIFGLTAFSVSTWTLTSILLSPNPKKHADNITHTEVTAENNETLSHELFLAKLHTFSEHFGLKMIVCTCLADVVSFLQVIVSLSVLCSSSKKVSQRSKYLLGVHFVTFITLLVCLFVPLGYDRDNETLHSITSFNDKLMTSFSNFVEMGVDYIVIDVHAYYFALVFDLSIIFILMVLTCCLMRCETSIYDPV